MNESSRTFEGIQNFRAERPQVFDEIIFNE